MPRDGSGNFNLSSGNPVSPNTVISSTTMNSTLSDIGAALTQSLSKDGQTVPTANLSMGNNKIINLATGTLASDAARVDQTSANVGQCRLTKSGSNLLLSPFMGNGLTINGVVCKIPAAGITLAPTALSAGTTYYIYATASGTSVNALEASTTTHATDATTGVEIKTGDATRTLVGMARPITGPAFADTSSQRFVVSWFNRRPVTLVAVIPANQGNSGTSYSVLLASLLLEFLTWGDAVSAKFQGGLTNNVANAISITSIFVDGSGAESYTSTGAYVSAAVQPVYCSVDTALSEGYHSFQVYALQNVTSTATYTGAGTAGARCVHSAVIQG